MDFKGQVAIVTGSAAGIGAATALAFAKAGAHVVINYSKSADEAKAAEAACRDAGADTLLVQANVAEDADCRRMAKEALDKWGRIDVLVNNAGTTKFAGHADLDALNAEDFSNIFGVNVTGAYQMIRAVAPAMKAQGRGSVVNIASIAGVTGIGSSVAYAASKGALSTMTLSLARALAPEIRVNAVCPGYVGTRWFRERFGEERFQAITRNQEETTPLRRAGTPEDIAGPILFFAGDSARNVTGEFMLVDAGMHLDLTPTKPR